MRDTKSDGVKEDKSKKARWDLMDWSALNMAAEVMALGCGIHKDDAGWKNKSINEHFASCQRHLVAYFTGEKYDLVTGKHHLSHALCRVMFMLALELEGTRE